MLKVISRKLVRKALEMIRQLAEYREDQDEDEEEDVDDDVSGSEDEVDDDNTKDNDTSGDEDEEEDEEDRIEAHKQRYEEFWKEYGKNIKLGIIEDSSNRPKLAKFLRWYSSNDVKELTSFDEYLSRMKPGQDSIYFIAGETKEQLMTSPTLQKLLKKGYEVLLCEDPIDEYVFQHLTEYEKKKL